MATNQPNAIHRPTLFYGCSPTIQPKGMWFPMLERQQCLVCLMPSFGFSLGSVALARLCFCCHNAWLLYLWSTEDQIGQGPVQLSPPHGIGMVHDDIGPSDVITKDRLFCFTDYGFPPYGHSSGGDCSSFKALEEECPKDDTGSHC